MHAQLVQRKLELAVAAFEDDLDGDGRLRVGRGGGMGAGGHDSAVSLRA